MITFNLKNKLLYPLTTLFLLCTQTLKIKADGAGILPFIKVKNELFFLLSEDKHRAGFWTDFGGSGQANIENAAKEGHEETMGIFTGHHNKPHLQEDKALPLLKRKLNEKKCLRRRFSDGFEYVTYLFDTTESVKCLGGMEKTINLFYNTLRKLNKKWNRHIYCHYCEKTSFQWITKEKLLQAIDKNKSINGKKLFRPFRENLREHRNLITSL